MSQTASQPAMVRCETCLGLGYKGRTIRGQWKIVNCPGCRGTGSRPASDRQNVRTTHPKGA